MSKTSTQKKDFPAALYIVSVLVVALGLCFIFLVPQGYSSYQAQSRASSWPQAAGQVISAEVKVQSRVRNPSKRHAAAGSGISVAGDGQDLLEEKHFQPRVVTQYSVNGKTYTTREISFNQSRTWSTDSDYAAEVVAQYPPGSEIAVYYNPDLPSEAVLSTRYDWFTFFIMGLGATFVLAGIYWFWLSLRDTYLFFAGLLKNKER